MCGCAGFGANGPGGCCVCVVDASKNVQGKGFEVKHIVPALPGTLSVYMYVYIFICCRGMMDRVILWMEPLPRDDGKSDSVDGAAAAG